MQLFQEESHEVKSLIQLMGARSFVQKLEYFLASNPIFFRFLISSDGLKGTWFKYMKSGGYAVPREHSKRASNLSAFLNGSSLVVNKLWPVMLFVMQLYDIAYFCAHPGQHDGVTFGKILGGTARSKYSYSSQWWNNFPSGASYAAIPSILFFGMLVSGNISLVLNHFEMTSFLKTKYEVLWMQAEANDHYKSLEEVVLQNAGLRSGLVKNLSDWNRLFLSADIAQSFRSAAIARFNPGFTVEAALISEAGEFLFNKATSGTFAERFIARYLLWSLGVGMHGFNNKTTAVSTRVLFWVANLYKIYALARLLELWGFKLAGLFSDKVKRLTPIGIDARAYECEQEGKQWRYRAELGQVFCSVCPDWPIFLRNIFTEQDCLDGLMAAARTPTELVRYISQLRGDLTSVDMSEQDFAAWTAAELDEVLGSIEAKKLTHMRVSLSQSLEKNVRLNEAQIKRLSEFLKKLSANKIFLNNLGVGSQGVKSLLSSPDILRLVVAGNALGDDGLAYLLRILLPSVLQSLDVANNGIQTFPKFDNRSALIFLRADGNPLQEVSFQNMRDSLSTTALQNLSLARTEMSPDGFVYLTSGFPNSTLVKVLINSNQIGSDALIESLESLWNSGVRDFDFSDVNLDDDFLVALERCWPMGKPIHLNMGDNFQCSELGLSKLGLLINSGRIISLKLSGNQFASESWIDFFKTIVGSRLELLSISNSNLGDAEIAVLTGVARNLTELSTLSLKNNLFSGAGIVPLLGHFKNSSISRVDLSQNNLVNGTDVSIAQVIGRLISNPALHHLNLACTGLGDNVLLEIASHLKGARLQDFNYSNNRATDVGINSFVRNMFDPVFIGGSLGASFLRPDDARDLYASKPSSDILSFDVSGNSIGTVGARALARGWVAANLSCSELFFDRNPFNTSQVSVKTCSVLPYNNTGPSQKRFLLLADVTTQSSRFDLNSWILLIILACLFLARPVYARVKTNFFRHSEDDNSRKNARRIEYAM